MTAPPPAAGEGGSRPAATAIPSRRFLVLAGLALLPAALATLHPAFLAVALGYLACCGVLLAAEYAYGATAGRFFAVRRAPARLSLSEAEEVTLEVRNGSAWPARVAVLDSPPPGWEVEGLPAELRLGARETATITYRCTPTARGRYRFGDLYLRVEHFPGLLTRQLRLPAEQEARVYPDLREVRKYEVMARRSRLQELGFHRSRLAGRGTEFEQIREYTPDDEYRQIDWKATARRRKPMSRVYEVERSQNIFLCLDAGRMMAGRVGKMAKLDYAVNAALMVAHVALRAGDRVGLMVVSDGVDAYLPFGKGPAHLNTCLEVLYGVEARHCHVDYRAALEQIAVRCKRRSLVVFFTDLIDEETSADLVTYMRLLRPQHLPLCVTLQDAGVVRRSLEPPAAVPEMYERAVALELLGERRRILDSLQKLGALVLDCPPEELSVAVINEYLELKSRQLL